MSERRHRSHHVSRPNDDGVSAALRDVIARCGLAQVKQSPQLVRNKAKNSDADPEMIVEEPKEGSSAGIDWEATSDVITFEQLAPEWTSSRMCQKLMQDLRVGDCLCASVAHVKTITMELKLLCTMSRFRRCVSAFMPNKRFVVAYDRSKKIYQSGDYVKAHIKSIDLNGGQLELGICEDEAILQSHQLPSYYSRKKREHSENREGDANDDPTSYDSSDAMRRLRGNANLAEFLSIRIDWVRLSGLRCFEGQTFEALQFTCDGNGNEKDEAISIRRAQNRRLAMTHVERGAELTRAGRCFEAIQCFNRAINVDESCADAYVGRGAACAGSNNFSAALSDMEKALELDPDHGNARRYRIEILIAFAKSLEKEEQFADSYTKFLRAYELSGNTNERAANALKRLAAYRPQKTEDPAISSTPQNVEVVDLASDNEEDISKSSASGLRLKRTKRRKLEAPTSLQHQATSRNGRRSSTSAQRSFMDGSRLEASVLSDESFVNATNGTKKGDGDFDTSASFMRNISSVSIESLSDANRTAKEEENRRKLREMEAFIASLRK